MFDILTILTNVLNIIIWPIFSGAAVIMFVWAGFIFLTAQGDPAKITQAKKAVVWGIIGIAVGLAAFSMGNIIKAILGV